MRVFVSHSGQRLLIFILGVMAALATLSRAEDTALNDPIVGRWRWHNNTILAIRGDGTVGWNLGNGKGTWKCASPNQDPRKYLLDWERGLYVETLYLKKHGNRLTGHDQFGHHVWGYRLDD